MTTMHGKLAGITLHRASSTAFPQFKKGDRHIHRGVAL
jgi:hypothetical protein